jgi:hypothetical protein
MKKYVTLSIFLLMMNGFSAQYLNNRTQDIFSSNKEMKNLIFGNYNLDTELAVASKVKGNTQESVTKAQNDGILTMQTAIKNYSYEILSNYLASSVVSGPGFDNKTMKELADQISSEAIKSVKNRGQWTSSKKETIVLYTIEKQYLKDLSIQAFNKKLQNVINQLSDYKSTFKTKNDVKISNQNNSSNSSKVDDEIKFKAIELLNKMETPNKNDTKTQNDTSKSTTNDTKNNDAKNTIKDKVKEKIDAGNTKVNDTKAAVKVKNEEVQKNVNGTKEKTKNATKKVKNEVKVINTNLKNATVTTTPATSTPAITKTPKAVKVKKEDVKAKEKKVIVIPKTKATKTK